MQKRKVHVQKGKVQAVTKSGTGMEGRGDACLGCRTRGRKAWGVGRPVWGDVGTRGCWDMGDSRSGTQGGEIQKITSRRWSVLKS